MTNRIDHAAEAQKVLAMPTSVWGSPSEMLAAAQVNATLAIVEQLRIGNLIALANASHMSESFDDTEEAQRYAAYKLIAYRKLDPDDELPVIAPDIAAALGIDHKETTMSDQSDNRFYRQWSSSSEHEIQRDLRRQIASDIDTTINQVVGELEWGTYRNGFVAGLEVAKKIARGEA